MALRFNLLLPFLLPGILHSAAFHIASKSISCCGLQGVALTLPDHSKKWILRDGLVATAGGLVNGKKTACKQFILSSADSSQVLFINGRVVKGPSLLTMARDRIVVTQLTKQESVSFFDCQRLMADSAEKKRVEQEPSIKIRVLLALEKIFSEPKEFCIGSSAGFLITSELKKISFLQNKLTVKISKGSAFLNKKLLPEGIYRIETTNNTFLFNGKLYKGSLIVRIEEEKIFFVNAVDLEEYVYAVLRSESWPGWSVEVNKALAIACRSYAVAMIDRTASHALYHVQSSNIHQQYNLYGDHDNKKVRDAVEQTRGICLTYEQKPVLAMYDSCCGGLVPALIDELDFKKAPYLARSYACHYCKKSSLYEWNVVLEKSNLVAVLKKIDVPLKNISHMSVSKRDKAGVVKSIKIRDGKKEIIISGKTLYSVIKGIKSFSFSIKYAKNQVEFFGTGYGHSYGLCQWGAHEKVKQGSLFDEVLQFYYPGTKLKAMYVKKG